MSMLLTNCINWLILYFSAGFITFLRFICTHQNSGGGGGGGHSGSAGLHNIPRLNCFFSEKMYQRFLAFKNSNSDGYNGQEKQRNFLVKSTQDTEYKIIIYGSQTFVIFIPEMCTKGCWLRAKFKWVSLTGTSRTNCEDF